MLVWPPCIKCLSCLTDFTPFTLEFVTAVLRILDEGLGLAAALRLIWFASGNDVGGKVAQSVEGHACSR